MKIEKEKLKQALEIVKPGLSSKEMIEQSTSFCFLNGRVVTYNDQISISHPIDLDLTGAINAQELYAFISKISAEELDLEINEDETEIQIKAGRSRAGLKMQAEIILPLDEIGEIKKWKKLPDDFAAGLKFAMGSCSRDMSKPILTCVHCSNEILTGGDDFRISQYKLQSEIPTKEFLIPADAALKVAKLIPESINLSDGWVHFKTNTDTIISCRIFEDEYPDVTEHLKGKGIELIFPKGTTGMIERAGIFSKRDHILDEMIEIAVSKGRLQIKSESDSGWFRETEKVNYKGDDILFNVTPYLLKDILSETLNGLVMSNKLMFKAPNWKYVTLLK